MSYQLHYGAIGYKTKNYSEQQLYRLTSHKNRHQLNPKQERFAWQTIALQVRASNND